MKRDQIESLIPAVVDDLLRIWAMFMRRGSFGKGYPTKSAGFYGVGVSCWDDLEEEHYSATATEVNTVMNDLESRDYIAISNFYCSKGWSRYTDGEVEALLNGVERFRVKARERGMIA